MTKKQDKQRNDIFANSESIQAVKSNPWIISSWSFRLLKMLK